MLDSLYFFNHIECMDGSSDYEAPDTPDLMTEEDAKIVSEALAEAVELQDNGDFSDRGVLGALATIVRNRRDFEAPFN
jgi:hypothetical protein